MGPYCRFCDQRCFVYLPAHTPRHILDAYGSVTIIATCPAGKAHEKAKTGYCLDDIPVNGERHDHIVFDEYSPKGGN